MWPRDSQRLHQGSTLRQLQVMVIPRFSILWLMGLTLVCAFLSLILSFAVRGEQWAIGVMAALGSVVALVALYIVAFFVAWLLAQIEQALRSAGPQPVSPFQAGSTPTASPFAPVAPPVAIDVGDSTPPPMTG